MRIERVAAGAAPAARRKAAGAAGFADELKQDAAREAAPAGAVEVAVLPEGDIGGEADRRARRHGGAMLRALGALQLAMLGDDETAARAELAGLADAAPEAHDPVLRLILREIGLRAAVELARGAI